jgi:hypothetical protein
VAERHPHAQGGKHDRQASPRFCEHDENGVGPDPQEGSDPDFSGER